MIGSADGVFCVAVDGRPLASASCGRLLASQGTRVLQLIAVPPQRITHGSRHRRRIAAWLLIVHVMLAAIATATAVATLVVVFKHPFMAALIVRGSLDAVSWWFYAAVLLYESSRARYRQSRFLVLVVVFIAIYGLLGILYDDNALLWTRYPVVAKLRSVEDAMVYGLAVLAVTRHAIQHYESTSSESQPSKFSSSLGGKILRPSPFDRTGWLSRISYWWISPFIALGQVRRLEIDDIPELPKEDATALAAKKFKQALERELQQAGPQNASFLRVARRLYGWEVLCFAAWSTLNKCIGLASPLLIKLFLDWADESQPQLPKGYALAGAMVLRSMVASVSGTQYGLAWKRFDLRVRAGVISAIYNRSLTLSTSAKRRYGLGRITNLISVDLGRLVGMPNTVFDMFLIPGEIVFALFLLSNEVSYAFVAGLVVLGVMLPVQTLLGGKIQSVTKFMLQYRDERVNLTAECLKAIKTIKLLAWVDVYLAKVDAYRQLEMGRLAVRKYLDALCVFFWASTPVIVQTSVFATVIYSGHDITAANAFTAVSLLDRLIFPMNYFPWIINGFLEARVSALRIRDFLFAWNDHDGVFIQPSILPPKPKSERQDAVEKRVVKVSDCIFVWGKQADERENDESDDVTAPLMPEASPTSAMTSSSFELSIEELMLKPNRDYVVCSPVGAGKSSLLLALLGEMRRQSGEFGVLRPRASYAPQTPWLFRATVRQNITMCSSADGEDQVDEDLYRHVLQVCELDHDLEKRPLFDRTLVSENGNNFSGGQKLRINLARALYQRTSLYLLDDPLSGLDAKTAARIITNCFRSEKERQRVFPPGATVVLVTHSIHLLELFPRSVEVIVMDNGSIVESGSYDALLRPDSQSTRLQSMLRDRRDTRRQESDETVSDQDALHESTLSASGAETNKPEASEPGADEKHAEEHREGGVVNIHVWKAYATSIGWPLALLILVSITVMQLSRNGLDWWIGVYTNSHNVKPVVFANTLLWITAVNCTSVFFRSFLFASGGLRAAKSLYEKLVTSVFHAPLCFFDETPVGRILNRLSGDAYSVDESLPFILNIFLKDFADVVGALVILFYGNKFVLLLLVPLSIVYFFLQQSYRPTARHIRRLDSVTQSPILNMFTETLDGLYVIRAMKLESAYVRAYESCLNLSQRMSFLGANTGSWFGIRLDMLGVCVTSFVAIFAVAEFQFTGAVNPGILGLTLTYALPIVSKLNAVLGSFIDTEQQMIAVERVKEYVGLPAEDTVVSQPRHATLPSSASLRSSAWPSHGQIDVHGLTVTYRTSTTTVAALSDINCAIQAGEKIGICGRTGAGKSTFLNVLFRAVAWTNGDIFVDGINLASLSLYQLRSRLTYIPQEIVLFSGTVRSNLDPDDHFDAYALWTCLTKCGLDVVVSKLPRGLESIIEPGEATFSLGQSQLLCIARALLRPSKVLCIDEATSSIDHETDKIVSTMIRKEFGGSTVLTVAHRIETIMSCDRVLVFDQGRIVESGNPTELAANPETFFHTLANGSESALL
uniref:ABC-type xenobiotic transporter n=1 Tax=Globisporangium ultimum (strain ATCC 200006 / CBS 805.95 / DAOM BR144) TaxID=431595 RepID=K3WUY0_GLOUD